MVQLLTASVQLQWVCHTALGEDRNSRRFSVDQCRPVSGVLHCAECHMWPSLRRFTMKLLSYRDVWEDGRLWPLRQWTISWSHVPNIHSLFVCCSLELIYICIGGERQWSIKKIWWVPPATQAHFPCCAQLNTLTPINKPTLLCLYLSCSFIMIFQPADLRRSNPGCQSGHLFPF